MTITLETTSRRHSKASHDAACRAAYLKTKAAMERYGRGSKQYKAAHDEWMRQEGLRTGLTRDKRSPRE